MAAVTTCNVCSRPDTLGPESEVAYVRSNIRRFRDERFAVWRCRSCGSIHARDEVDLDYYYRHYPFYEQKLDWTVRAAYRNLLRRLTRAGLRRSHSILDYGCGSGLFVRYLVSRGFTDASGYDAYYPEYTDEGVLDRRYDCVVSQDVIEHSPEPRTLLESFDRMATPGGLVAIGTPDAGGVDLSQPERNVHALHQPYHTHMVSRHALQATADELGWTLVRLYRSSYVNTPFPFINHRFGLHYGRFFDDCLDLAFEGLKLSPKLLMPRSLFLVFFGSLRPPTTDMMAIFRTRG